MNTGMQEFSHVDRQEPRIKNAKRPFVEKVVVKIIMDYDHCGYEDFGAYTDNPEQVLKKRGLSWAEIRWCWHDGTIIDRTQGGNSHIDRQSYRYFVCEAIVGRERKNLMAYRRGGYTKQKAEEQARKLARLQYELVRDLENQYWNYVGIRAEALVLCPVGGSSYRIQDFESGGLWGIEWGDVPTDLEKIAGPATYNKADREKKLRWQHETHRGKLGRYKVRHRIDENDPYIKQIVAEQLDELVGHMKAVSKVRIPKEMLKNAQVVICDDRGNPIN